MINTILNIIFPVNCLSCGKNGFELCIRCLSDCPPAERESAKWIFPLFDYRHPLIKKSIWLLKYKGKKRISNIFAEVLYGRIIEEMADLLVLENFKAPILIPIPLSSKRKRERGFNQTELICKKLIKLDKENIFKLEKNVLIKPKETEHQAKIEDRAKRLKNIVGSFAVKNIEKIKDRNIILIDDVSTTGATLSEARKILKQAGAKKIIAFTVAH
ncbi:MAG: phosphoribosyltransferase family protein [Candidatus Paceibacterota bacterium]|jgi:competence protein ComFC